MSIIEKAVGKLGGQTEPAESEDGVPQSSVAASIGAPAAKAPAWVEHAGEQSVMERAAVEAAAVEAAAVEAAALGVRPQSATRVAPAGSRATPPGYRERPRVEIPFEALHERGMLTPAVPRSVVAEAFRTIKRPLLRNMALTGSNGIEFANLVMVTSALQGEGKTHTSISLAISLAMEQDKRVLFIDADIAKAAAGNSLGVPRDSLGLIDVLERDDVGLSDVILKTNMDKLSIVPAGAFHERCNELLASDGMLEIMQEMSLRYPDRVVIFDSPPMLLTTEAGVLANLMGQIVFVVQADYTPQHVVAESLERISEDKVVGMVLNQARSSKFNRLGYGYGYGYGYGHAAYGEGARYPKEAPEGSAGT